jgi:hypothetical protein
MTGRRLGYLAVCCVLAGLCAAQVAAASEYSGTVTFGGLPLPGATITATQVSAGQGAKQFSVTSDQGGLYRFDDLPDGEWQIEIAMPCFTTLHATVTVAPRMPAGSFALQVAPAGELSALAKAVQAAPAPVLNAANAEPKAEKPAAANNAPADVPKPPEEPNQDSSDGFLVNGSVNNAATSQYSLDRAFGNRRSNSRSLYNGGVGAVFGNSALNARAYSLSGEELPKPFYNLISGLATVGGPINIPRLMPRGPTFFAAYEWTRNQTEQDETGLVPTDAERAGNLAGLTNALGQPVTIVNPATGLPFAGNQVPVASQAQALLALYPKANIVGNPLYNYQAPALSDNHEDVVQTRLAKEIGRKDDLTGRFNLQSTRAGAVNLFGFVDKTDSLGLNTSVHWSHRFSQRLFVNTGYQFSRLRTQLKPEFEGRTNVSGAAGINGNDQDRTDWGPPGLTFSSGIASLSDANSEFNRTRTDALTVSAEIYRGRHNIKAGVDYRRQDYNDLYQQNPRGVFSFTGAATAGAAASATTTTTSGSDLADFLIGVPDTSSIAYGNADKYFRQPVTDVYVNDDWRVVSVLTVNAGARWEYGAPMTELHGRLVNLDVARGFTAAAPVLGNDPVGPVTGMHYPGSLIRPDRTGFEPRIGISWRPIPASTVVVRAGYGVYHDTSVYLGAVQQLAQQAPLSTSLNVENSAACPLTLAEGFKPCSTTSADTYAVDPNFRVGYAQTWQLEVQRDLPFALQMKATYLGVKGTHGVQEFLPNTYPIGAVSPCPACPVGFEYRTSGGDSTRESGTLQLRRRLRAGLTASLLYVYSKSIDDDALLGGQGHQSASSSTEENSEATPPAASASQNASIAQNWLDLGAERSLSTFDQRHVLTVQAQYTTGQGREGGTLMSGWAGRVYKEWTLLTQIKAGTGMPESPSYLAAVPETGFTGSIRPNLTGADVYATGAATHAARGLNLHLNAAAYTAPAAGQWGTAGRDSITGPAQFSLDSSLQRTFRLTSKYNLSARIDGTNVLNHAVFSSWITAINNTQFGLPAAANAMRSLQVTMRLRF